MGRPSARTTGSARVAVLGSSSVRGARMRQALAEFGLPGSRVALYGVADKEEPILSEYDGEARLIQTPDLEELVSKDVVFLCETGQLVERLVAAEAASTRLVDLVRLSKPASPVKVVHMDVNPEDAEHHRGLLAVPHDLATLLIDLLHPLERELGCEEVVAAMLRPAADFGEAGVEELREQTVRLLNFSRPPSDVLGRQLAFNVLPQSVLPDASSRLEDRIASEVRELLGWSNDRLALRLAAVPVFYGHTVQLRVRLSRETTPQQLSEILAGLGVAVDGKRTPLEQSAERGTSVAEISPDGLDGFWLWAVAGEAHARSAELAVRTAAAVSDL